MNEQKKYSHPEIKHFTTNQGSNFCKNFTSEIPKGRKKTLGRFFVIVEAIGPIIAESIKKDLESLALKAKQEYYSSENQSAAIALENTIKKIGPVIKKICAQNDVNALAAVIGDDNFYFSKYGKIYACLHKNNGLSAINAKSKRKVASKSFSEIIAVPLYNDDQILILNDGFSNACQPDDLQNLFRSDSTDIFNELKNHFETALAENQLMDSVAFAVAGMQKISPKTNQLPESKEEEYRPAVIPEKTENNSVKNISNVISVNAIKLSITGLSQNKFLSAAIIGLLAFSGIQIYQKVSAQNQFEEISKAINGKKNEAMALISANNNNEAVAKLLEAKNIYTPTNKSDPRLRELINGVEQELNITAKITAIDKPEKLSDLSNFGIKFSPQNIFKSGSQLLITGADFGLAYRADIESGQKGFSFFSTIDDQIKSATKSSDLIMFFTNGNKAYIYDAETNKTSDFDFEKTENQLVSFNGKTVGILDKNTRQLEQLSANDFRKTGKITIPDQIKDIASDSKNIFALSEENKIIKIDGEHQEKIIDIDSILLFDNPDLLVTGQNLNNIYVVNKKQSQIAIFAKDGQFLGQYNIKNTGGIIDLFIENDKEIFILENDAVYKITLSL